MDLSSLIIFLITIRSKRVLINCGKKLSIRVREKLNAMILKLGNFMGFSIDMGLLEPSLSIDCRCGKIDVTPTFIRLSKGYTKYHLTKP